MFVLILGLLIVIMGAIVVLAMVLEKREKGHREGASILAICGIAFLLVGAATITVEVAEGLPKNTYGPDFGFMLPAENLPLVVKTVDIEEKWDGLSTIEEVHFFLTVVSYNDKNGTRTFYRIPIENIENPNDIKAGAVVINDGGVLKPFSIIPEV